MKRIQINKIFNVLCWDNSVIDGEFCPDVFEEKRFQVFTKALCYAKKLKTTSQIEEVHVYNKHPFESIGTRWEVDIDDYCVINAS